MKYSGVTKESKIQEAITLLYHNLAKQPHEEFEIVCGGFGEKDLINICYSEIRKFWWGSKNQENKNKYWNPVGFNYPNPKIVNVADCEFNCSIKGFNSSSVFAKDYKNNIYLFHNGKAGGNTSGTTIENFRNFYKEDQICAVSIDDKIYDLFLVTELNSENLLVNLMRYATAIYDFKMDLKLKNISKQ